MNSKLLEQVVILRLGIAIGVLVQRGFNLDNMAGVNYSFHYDENSFIYHQFVFTAP